MTSYKLKPSDYYTMHGGSGGTHCRRCNEVLTNKKTVTLYCKVAEGTWHTEPQLDDNDELDEFGEEFGSACAKAALAGN